VATQHADDEADIRRQIGKWSMAVCAMDLAGVMPIYVPDVVSFDLDPPLRYVGAEAKRKRWADVFAMYRHLAGYEVHDLSITLGDDVAFGHSLNRVSGTLKNGSRTDFWLRWTMGFRKIDSNWFIAHEQLSVPVDPKSGRALLDLEP
jgi:ketosteroid isomerase-like protein